jgi:DNA-binding response OmpR family regulator
MNKKTVLVADDESRIRNVLSLKLRNAGFRVLTAADGTEALMLALAEKPDLLITDYQMPRLSGLELCRRMRQNPATSQTPAILLTARGYELGRDDTAESGILRTIGKPFSPRQLVLVVNELLTGVALSGAAA